MVAVSSGLPRDALLDTTPSHPPTLVLRHAATPHTVAAALRWLRAGGRVFAFRPHGIDFAEALRTRLDGNEGLSLTFRRNMVVVTLDRAD